MRTIGQRNLTKLGMKGDITSLNTTFSGLLNKARSINNEEFLV